MITLDTNVVIYYLAGDSAIGVLLKTAVDNAEPMFVSGLTETELLSLATLTDKEIRSIEAVIDICTVIHTNPTITRLAATLRRVYKTPTIDALVAATAMYTGSTLLTRNVKDFHNISELLVKKV